MCGAIAQCLAAVAASRKMTVATPSQSIPQIFIELFPRKRVRIANFLPVTLSGEPGSASSARSTLIALPCRPKAFRRGGEKALPYPFDLAIVQGLAPAMDRDSRLLAKTIDRHEFARRVARLGVDDVVDT